MDCVWKHDLASERFSGEHEDKKKLYEGSAPTCFARKFCGSEVGSLGYLG